MAGGREWRGHKSKGSHGIWSRVQSEFDSGKCLKLIRSKMRSILPTILIGLGLIQACNGAKIDLKPEEIQEALDLHNQYRKSEGATAMLRMKWNEALQQFAQSAADRCSGNHTQDSQRSNVAGFNLLGESWFGTTGASITLKAAIENWYTEKPKYDLGTNQCATANECGHYTQIVAARTSDVGCALTDCGDWKYAYCNYGPIGNLAATPPFERAASAGEVGSKCASRFTNTTADLDGLCVPSTGHPQAKTVDATTSTITSGPTTPTTAPGAPSAPKRKCARFPPPIAPMFAFLGSACEKSS